MDLKKVIIVIIVLLIIVSFWQFYIKGDSGKDDPSNSTDIETIRAMINQTNSTKIRDDVEYLQNLGTRYIGTEGNRESTEWIKGRFDSFGLETYYHNFTYEGITLSNVIGVHEGVDKEEKIDTYILSAHLDSINRNGTNMSAPGADDDASGIATIIESARILSGYDFDKTIMFCAWNAEEVGLIGSRAFVEDIDGRDVSGAYQFDMVGYGSDGHNISINANLPSKDLADVMENMRNELDISLNVTQIINEPETRSDHYSFWLNKYKASLIIEETYNPYYHTDEDTVDKLSISMIEKVTKLAVSSSAELADLSQSTSQVLSEVRGSYVFPQDLYQSSVSEFSIMKETLPLRMTR